MTDLRKYAKGKPCMIRLPGICNGQAETTVLCHVRLIGLSGAGLKAPDLLAAWGCFDCHDIVDRRRKTSLRAEDVVKWFYEGVLRTQAKLIEDGVLTW